MQHYTGYKPSELEKCVRAIHELQRNTKNCTLPAIREKYRQHKVIFWCRFRSIMLEVFLNCVIDEDDWFFMGYMYVFLIIVGLLPCSSNVCHQWDHPPYFLPNTSRILSEDGQAAEPFNRSHNSSTSVYPTSNLCRCPEFNGERCWFSVLQICQLCPP